MQPIFLFPVLNFMQPLGTFSMTSLKQHIEYFNFRCKIQLDLPVHDAVEDVAERALGLVALDEGDLDPRAWLDVQHLHAVSWNQEERMMPDKTVLEV